MHRGVPLQTPKVHFLPGFSSWYARAIFVHCMSCKCPDKVWLPWCQV
jgi:hypothetical protein